MFGDDIKDVLNFLIKIDSKNKDVLFVLFNLIKKICGKIDLTETEQLEILKKCKDCWCYKFLRGVLVQIFTLLSSSNLYFDILPLDFIVRYNLWTKETFYSSRYVSDDIDLSETIGGELPTNKNFNISLVVKFLKSINFMNYKYLRKTLLILDMEMFNFLPNNYTEMGLTNLKQLLNEYKNKSCQINTLEEYLNAKFPSRIPLLANCRDMFWIFHSSNVIRKEFLKQIENFKDLFEFIKYSQMNEDDEMVDLIYKKLDVLIVDLEEDKIEDL